MSKKMGIFLRITLECVVFTLKIGASRSKMSMLAWSLLMTLKIWGNAPGVQVIALGGGTGLGVALDQPKTKITSPNIFLKLALFRGGDSLILRIRYILGIPVRGGMGPKRPQSAKVVLTRQLHSGN